MKILISLVIFTNRKNPAYYILSVWLQMWGGGNFIHFRLDTIAMYLFCLQWTMNVFSFKCCSVACCLPLLWARKKLE